MTDMDPVQMQIDMIKAQVETQKNMYRQMYASDPAMAEQFCEQLDKNMQLQIEMIRQMMGAAADGGYVDPAEQARIAMEQLGYSDDEMSQVLGVDGGDSLTERILGDKDPSEFGYGDIVEAISSISELGEPQPARLRGHHRGHIVHLGARGTSAGAGGSGPDEEVRGPPHRHHIHS